MILVDELDESWLIHGWPSHGHEHGLGCVPYLLQKDADMKLPVVVSKSKHFYDDYNNSKKISGGKEWCNLFDE